MIKIGWLMASLEMELSTAISKVSNKMVNITTKNVRMDNQLEIGNEI